MRALFAIPCNHMEEKGWKRMIEVDISNVWGELALPDLLAMEKEVFDAHLKLTEDAAEEKSIPGWLHLPAREETEELVRIRKCAERICSESQVCVVVGAGGRCLGVRAAMELLQGIHRNLGNGGKNPQIFFAGSSLSTRKWNELVKLLDGKDYSVVVVSKSGTTPESAIAFRGLRWMLERKYGTDEANSRIYAVTDPEQGALRQMAQEAGWETFVIPSDVEESDSVLTAAGLLPMAVAGIDIMEIMNGAMDGKENYDLRSYENPVWLYTAVRSLFCRGGRKTELITASEPDFRCFGSWWQQLLGASGGLFPAVAECTAAMHALGQQSVLETMVRFAPCDTEYIIGSDWKNPDGMNCLEGKPLSVVEEQAYLAMLNDHVDSGVPVLVMDCGDLTARTVGELFYFLELSRGISAYMTVTDSVSRTEA